MYEFKTEPWEHQRAALLATWNKTYHALLMGYGTGKTKVVIDNAGILFERGEISALFIIAPNEVHEQWIDEQIPMHLPDRIERIQRIWTGATSEKFKRSLTQFWEPYNKDKLKVFSMNVEALQISSRAKNFAIRFLTSFRTMLVVDESTRIKTPGAKRTMFIINQLAPLATYKRTLTGNEVTRSPFDVYSPYRFLRRDFWTGIPNNHIFQHHFGAWKKNKFQKKDVVVKDIQCPHCLEKPGKILLKRQSGVIFPCCELCNGIIREKEKGKDNTMRVEYPKNLKKLLQNDGLAEYPTLIKYRRLDELKARTSAHSFLVRKRDCMDLPPKIYQPIYTKMNSEQTRLYKELKRDLVTEYNGEPLTVLNKIALSVRFQQIVGGFFPDTEEQIGDTNPKIDRLLYDLEDIDSGDPIIVWSCFVAEIKGIAKRLKDVYPERRVVTFYGDTPKPERKAIIEAFKAGKIDFFVANPMVAGTGLNLQRAHLNYYYSNTNNAEDRWQSEDRTNRGGQTKACLYKDIFIKGTVDDTIKRGNEEKKSLAEYFKTERMEDLV